MPADPQKIEQISSALPSLTKAQLTMLGKIVEVFATECTFKVHEEGSDIISEPVLQDFGDCLRIHHCFSREPFSKDKFEYALDLCLNTNGVKSELSPRGRKGYDIEIGGVRTSLKTQADKNIRVEKVHISKFMELGSGQWGDDPDDLEGLREQFLHHMKDYERIFTLRALRKNPPEYVYELVEIPKTLLAEAASGRLEMSEDSKQFPKPGYCYVGKGKDAKFSLYFDGGTERKLQIKHLKKSLCKVHAVWKFPCSTEAAETEEEKIVELE